MLLIYLHSGYANDLGVRLLNGKGKKREWRIEDDIQGGSQIMEQVGISERKAAALSGELEESKALMDSSERSKRQLEMEIADARNAVNNMQVINGRDMTAKRGLEGAIHTIQAEVDAMLGAAKNAEEKSKKAMVDAARLADELRAEQDHASSQVVSYPAPLCKCLALIQGFGQCKIRTYQPSNWPANKVML